MNFTVYDKKTGMVLFNGSCPPDQFDIQGQGHSIIEGTYESGLYYWDNEFKLIPPQPDGEYEFDYASKQWKLNTIATIIQNKSIRNNYLLQSDWTQLPDVDLTDVEKDRWKVYRQALRDMTEQDFLNGNFPIY